MLKGFAKIFEGEKKGEYIFLVMGAGGTEIQDIPGPRRTAGNPQR